MALHVLESLGIHIWIMCETYLKMTKRQKKLKTTLRFPGVHSQLGFDTLFEDFFVGFVGFNHGFRLSLTAGYRYKTLFPYSSFLESLTAEWN